MVGNRLEIWIAECLNDTACSNVAQFQRAVSAIGQKLRVICRIELNRRNTTFVYPSYLGTSVPRSDVPESESSVHMARTRRERIARNIDTIGRRAVSKGDCLPVYIARNVPNFHRAVGGASENFLFIMKQSNASDLVGVSRQLVKLCDGKMRKLMSIM